MYYRITVKEEVEVVENGNTMFYRFRLIDEREKENISAKTEEMERNYSRTVDDHKIQKI